MRWCGGQGGGGEGVVVECRSLVASSSRQLDLIPATGQPYAAGWQGQSVLCVWGEW
jgi:hypothetical protein